MKDLLSIHQALGAAVKTIIMDFAHTNTRESLQELQRGFQYVGGDQIFDLTLSQEITLKIFTQNSTWSKKEHFTMIFTGKCKEIIFREQIIVLNEPLYFYASLSSRSGFGKISFAEEIQHDFMEGHLSGV